MTNLNLPSLVQRRRSKIEIEQSKREEENQKSELLAKTMEIQNLEQKIADMN